MSSHSSQELDESVDYVKLSVEGVKLLLNNDWKAAQDLFLKHKDESILMSAGSGFVLFLKAILTFDEEQMDEASKMLQHTIERCKEGKVRRASRRKKSTEMSIEEDRLERQIIETDCLLYQAGLIIINQDVMSYVKGGWYIRHAWKRYKKLYHEIHEIHTRYHAKDYTNSTDDVPHEARSIDIDTLNRLYGAVSFGYGSFQLFISLVPPKILWWIEALGFESNQAEGLECLERASQTDDMKAPLATLVLVWYHTTVRPFFALDGTNLTAGIQEAERVLDKADQDFPNSALFLYFRSRIFRLQANTEESLAVCHKALEMAANQRETRHVCLYEIGRISMMHMEFEEAFKCFSVLKDESLWARCFYAYLAGVCCGALGDITKSLELMKEVSPLVRHKNNGLEAFVNKRSQHLLKKNSPDLTAGDMRLLAFEILYVWTIIPCCSQADLQRLLKDCQSEDTKRLRHLSCLIQSALYLALHEPDDTVQKLLVEAIELCEEGDGTDMHVAAFARFELGMLWSRDVTKHEESKKSFLYIRHHYKSYDFENRLDVKISAALKRLEDSKPTDTDTAKTCVIQ